MALRLLLCIVFLVVSSNSFAGDLGFEFGQGTKLMAAESNQYSASGVTYSVDLTDYFYSEFRVGLLDDSTVVSASLGAKTKGTAYGFASVGAAHLTKVPVELKDSEQFLLTLGYGIKLSDIYSVRVIARHLSNGADIFNNNKYPNNGVDSILFGIDIKL